MIKKIKEVPRTKQNSPASNFGGRTPQRANKKSQEKQKLSSFPKTASVRNKTPVSSGSEIEIDYKHMKNDKGKKSSSLGGEYYKDLHKQIALLEQDKAKISEELE